MPTPYAPFILLTSAWLTCALAAEERCGNLQRSIDLASRESFAPIHAKLAAEAAALTRTLDVVQDAKAAARHAKEELAGVAEAAAAVGAALDVTARSGGAQGAGGYSTG